MGETTLTTRDAAWYAHAYRNRPGLGARRLGELRRHRPRPEPAATIRKPTGSTTSPGSSKPRSASSSAAGAADGHSPIHPDSITAGIGPECRSRA